MLEGGGVKVELADWGIVVGIILGIWGAGLSTVLAVREIKKEKRRIKTFLEKEFHTGQSHLVIVNVGHRPVTLTGARIDTLVTENEEYWHPFSFDLIFDPSVGDPFPITISDGDQIRLRLTSILLDELEKEEMTARFFIFDAERNTYKVNMERSFRLGHDPGV